MIPLKANPTFGGKINTFRPPDVMTPIQCLTPTDDQSLVRPYPPCNFVCQVSKQGRPVAVNTYL